MANKIIHKHSSELNNNKAKLPSSGQLEYGELAVNYADGVETISMKNSQNEIVEFKSDEYYSNVFSKVDGEIDALQTQVNGKAETSHTHGTITLTGDVTGSASIGSGTTAIKITTTVANNSHTHTSSNISDSISASSGITSGATGLVQGKAVEAYAATKGHTHAGVYAPVAHASNANTYGVGTTANYGHVKISNGDVNTTAHADGLVAGMDHSHGNYSLSGHTHSAYAATGTVTALETRVGTAETNITNLQTADTALETAYKAADTALETAYKAADTALKTELNNAISTTANGLQEQINGKLASSHTGTTATTGATGHVKLVTGNLNGQTYASGVAAAAAHTHSQYSGTGHTHSAYSTTGTVSALETRITKIEGNDAGGSMRTVAADEVAKVVANAPEAFNTLKEIADWIGTGNTNTTATQMITDIAELKGTVSGFTSSDTIKAATTALQTTVNGKAPKAHASTGTTYGVGTTANYGHVKISNGDVNTTAHADGLVAGMDHSHSNYSLTGHTHNYSATGHKHTSSEITDSISASSGITSSATGLVQGKAVQGYAAPKAHSSTATTYGVATSGDTGKYGHVKLVTEDLNGRTHADGVAASAAHTHSQYAASGTVSALDTRVGTAETNITNLQTAVNGKAPKAHASTDTTYGIGKTGGTYGHVSLITGDLNGRTHADGVAASVSHTHSQYSGTGHTHAGVYAPVAHATTATTYGLGATGSTGNYGHVRLITGDLNGKNATNGEAAASSHTHSQYSASGHTHSAYATTGTVTALETRVTTVENGKAPNNHASSTNTYGLGTTANYGHVKISNGDVNTVTSADGLVAGMDHSHGNYSLTGHTHNYSATGHKHTSSEITDSISASSGITSGATGLVQGKAVEAYAATKSHTHSQYSGTGHTHSAYATTGTVTALETRVTTVENGKAPNNHASSANTYGLGTTANYGHVKISNGDVNTVAHADGLVAGMDHTHGNYSTTSHTHGKITLSGDVTGSATIGSGTTAINITTTVADNSHNHTNYAKRMQFTLAANKYAKIKGAGVFDAFVSADSTLGHCRHCSWWSSYGSGQSLRTQIRHIYKGTDIYVDESDSGPIIYVKAYTQSTNIRILTSSNETFTIEQIDSVPTGATNTSGNTYIIATLGDNVASATKATQDGSGNTITSTYATKTQLNAATTRLDTIEGTGTTSMKGIAQAEVAKIVDGAPTAFDTLKEIANWIGSGNTNTTATQMITDISNLKTTLTGFSKDATVKTTTEALNTAVSGKAPNDHASNKTTYGSGTTTNYGHVKLQSGELSGVTAHSDAIAASYYHTHGQYASKGHTHGTITLSGDVTGSASIGSGTTAIKITTTVADDSHNHTYIKNNGRLTALTGTSVGSKDVLQLNAIANDGYPITYGNLLRISGAGFGELACEWSGVHSETPDTGRIYYRSKRDVETTPWSNWKTVAWTSDIPTTLKNPNAIKFKNASGTTITYDGSSVIDLTGGINYAASAASATTAGTATNLNSAPSLTASGNTITVTAGNKTSAAFTVPYATSAGSATNATTATRLKHISLPSNSSYPTDGTSEYIKIGTVNIPTTNWYRSSIILTFMDYEASWYQGDILTIHANANGSGVGSTPMVVWTAKRNSNTIDSIIVSKISDNKYDLYLEAKGSYTTLKIYYMTSEEVGTDKIWDLTVGSWSATAPTITSRSSLLNVASSCIGNAATATKLGTETKGSASKPIYLSSGTPTACTSIDNSLISKSGGTSALAWNTEVTLATIAGQAIKAKLPANPDTNSDTKVTQTVTTTNASYPLLLAPSGQTATTTTTSFFDSGVTLNPSTNTIAANISGNAATATKTTNIANGAAGSIPYQSAANTTTFLAKGSAGQTLKMNSSGTAPVWVTDLYEKTVSLKVTTDWMDTGINAQTKFGDIVLPSGTYAVQITSESRGQGSLWSEIHSGMMSWYSDTTNSTDSDEIFLHKAGHASNNSGLFLRTVRMGTSGYLKLQIASKTAFDAASNITFKFKKLI